MTRVKARRGWLGPLLMFVVVFAVLLALLPGLARGVTATTVPATLAPGSPGSTGSAGSLDSSVSQTSASPSTATSTALLTVRARDLGGFDDTPPTITSPAAILIDQATGKVLYEHKSHIRRPMGSTTKIMTAILVLESMDMDTQITVSQKAAQTPEPKTWLRKGDVLTVEQLLYALLLRSANSAAVALAEGNAGSVDAFVAKMNAKAQELGMTDTHFVNPNGLDATGHYSTAADMAVLARYAMSNEKFRAFVGTKTYSLSLPGRSQPLVFTNTNKLLVGGVTWVTGVKTGLTPRADQCFVGSGTQDGVSVISVILGQPSTPVCFSESKALLEYGFSQYRHLTLVDSGVTVALSDVPYQLDGRLALVTKNVLDVNLYKDETVTASLDMERTPVLPVTAGETLGKVLLTVGGSTVGSVDLVADRSVGKVTLGSKLAYFWGRFTRWVGRVI